MPKQCNATTGIGSAWGLGIGSESGPVVWHFRIIPPNVLHILAGKGPESPGTAPHRASELDLRTRRAAKPN